ncbi:hypothetical protein K1719_020966 [Acacia pycnantha]|nr:hypothetical protein K1719_020966 [Acacia pycnantha]
MLRTEVDVRDRISDFPDSLLLHILSFLPAKEAIASSLLSKRWEPLWHSLPTLDLDRRDFQRLKFYHQFVDKMLKFVDLKSVKKFVLRLCNYETHEYLRPWKISKWINVVMSNKVEHLELDLATRKVDYELPSSVFTANNMKVLKLTAAIWRTRMGSSGVMVGTLSHINLPLLEVLHLEDILFRDFRSLGMLLSACALLKHLVITFRYLVTAEIPELLLPWKVFSNATYLRFNMTMFKSSLPSDNVPTFYNLTCLEFNYYYHHWDTLLKYLQSCPKLEILLINKLFHEGRLELTADVPHCVSSNLKEFDLGSCEGTDDEFELARYIMKNAMVLRIISITKGFWSRTTLKKKKNIKKIFECPINSVNCTLLLKGIDEI